MLLVDADVRVGVLDVGVYDCMDGAIYVLGNEVESKGCCWTK
jgi:hypothetical protein